MATPAGVTDGGGTAEIWRARSALLKSGQDGLDADSSSAPIRSLCAPEVDRTCMMRASPAAASYEEVKISNRHQHAVRGNYSTEVSISFAISNAARYTQSNSGITL